MNYIIKFGFVFFCLNAAISLWLQRINNSYITLRDSNLFYWCYDGF